MLRYVWAVVALVFLVTLGATAQDHPNNILAAEFQTPKPGMAQQYEQGRQQKADWHKQQKDSSPLYISEIVSGEATGTYLVTRGGESWADMDHPSIPEAADDDEYNKVVGPYVASLTESYYEFLPKLSYPDTSASPSLYTEILVLRVKFGKDGDFRSAVARISEAERKANPSSHVDIYELTNGGFTGTYVVAFPHARWADFEENPNTKPMAQVLAEAYGPDETNSIMATLDNSVESEYSEILKFRQDLSYIPAK